AFSEIHPDYYQIPVADRQALLEEEARSHRDDDEEPRGERRSRRHRRPRAHEAKMSAQVDERMPGPAEALELQQPPVDDQDNQPPAYLEASAPGNEAEP